MIRLFVGLGNPGAEYDATRHNAGAWWVDALAREWGVSMHLDRSYQGLVGRTTREGCAVWVLLPQTYMNLSGRSVAGLARFFRITPPEILVAHDELDLEPGHSKLKQGGSHAGHNGLRDIHAQMGSDAYWRLKLGIGHPGHRDEVVNWVLGRPIAEHRLAIADSISRTLKAAPWMADGDMTRATMMCNTVKPPRPKPAKPPKPVTPSPDEVMPTGDASS